MRKSERRMEYCAPPTRRHYSKKWYEQRVGEAKDIQTDVAATQTDSEGRKGKGQSSTRIEGNLQRDR